MNSLFGSQNHKSRWRPVHVAELLFLVVGLVCLGWVGWNWAATEVDQSWSNYELNAERRGEEPTVWGYIRDRDKKPESDPASQSEQQAKAGDTLTRDKAEKQTRARSAPAPAPKRYRVGATVGRVEMPRLRISAIVKYGVDDKTLKRAVGLVPGTALPGLPGNVGIAAHRDTFFRNLRDVKVGDRIKMTTPTGTWEYEVDSTKIVWPKNVEVLDPTPEPAITLVTCYPFNYVGNAPRRFIVRAKQVSPLSEPQIAAAKPAAPGREGATTATKKSRERSTKPERS